MDEYALLSIPEDEYGIHVSYSILVKKHKSDVWTIFMNDVPKDSAAHMVYILNAEEERTAAAISREERHETHVSSPD